MSSAPEGWYVDPSTGTNLRYWSGSTWTDEVAPLPVEPTHSDPVDLFGPAKTVETATETVETAPEATAEPQREEPPQAVDASLDPELERTRLSRRELRARRGDENEPDDTPKHLPPMAPPAAVSIEQWSEPEELEIPAPPKDLGLSGEDPLHRRQRLVRLSVLLGILAVATSVAVLTAGTL